MAQILGQLIELLRKVWEAYLSPLWVEYIEPVLVFFGEVWEKYFSDFFLEYGTDLILAPLYVTAVFFWCFVGYLCCPKNVRDTLQKIPFGLGAIIQVIVGIPFYFLWMIVAGIWSMLGAFWLILLWPLKALGVVEVGNSRKIDEPKIGTQVDVDE